MKGLREMIREAESNKVAIGHFNVSDSVGLKAIFAASQEANLALNRREATKELKLPVIIGVSEGERNFMGVRPAAALIKSLREEYDYPIFLNADHTHSLEKLKVAIDAGFDAAVFDGSKLPFEENIKKTKEAVLYAKSANPDFLIEGELGYIGGGSTILKEIPEGAAIKPGDLTKSEEARQFVAETDVDLLAPAVGNIHGLLAKAGTRINADGPDRGRETRIDAEEFENPNLDIQRIKELRGAAGVLLVLHGGSGIKNEDFLAAIDAGISIIHINTELRLAWRQGLEKSFKDNPEEIVPYKLLPKAIEKIKRVVEQKLKLFNRLV